MYIYMKLKINYNLVKKYQTGGGSEIHCYLCGAPVHNHSMYKLNNYKKYKKFIYDNLIDVDGMAQDKDSNTKFDVTYSIYKNLPEKILKEIYKNIENLEKKKKYQWLNNVLLLHWSGKILKIDKDKSDYWDRVFFDDSGIQQSINGHSFIVHNDCYKVTKTKYGDYTALNLKVCLDGENKCFYPDYKFLNKYIEPDYDWLEYFDDNNIDYVLESPLKNLKNKKRILNIDHKITKEINPILIEFLSIYKNNNNKIPNRGYKWMYSIPDFYDYNIFKDDMIYFENVINKSYKKINKKRENRPSPSDSATLYKVGYKKKGNDGNIYEVVVNKNNIKRWKKI